MGCTFQNSIHYLKNKNQIESTYLSDEEAQNHLHFVFWSGGCDSTLLLYELIETYGFSNVVAVSYKYPWLGSKYNNEKIHREAFKAGMRLKYGDIQIRHLEIDVSSEMVSGTNIPWIPSGLPQSVAWLLSVPLYVPPKSYIYDGGIKSDDLTLNIDSYNRTIESVSDLLSKDLVVRHPYIMMDKWEIIEKLFKYNMYQYTWFCEMSGDEKPCNNCHPCRTHITALMYLKEFSDDEFVRMKASRELSKLMESNNTHEEPFRPAYVDNRHTDADSISITTS